MKYIIYCQNKKDNTFDMTFTWMFQKPLLNIHQDIRKFIKKVTNMQNLKERNYLNGFIDIQI